MPKAGCAFALLASLCLGACAAPGPPPDGPRPPREVRIGQAEWAVQQVEADVSPAEVEAAVRAMIARDPVCTGWPTLWLDPAQRRTLFVVRFDLMTRDWGEELSAASRERMEEYVAMGFLNRRERPDIGEGAVEYTLTPAGNEALRGSPYSGERPTFCAPAERRLLAVTAMAFTQSDCGNLRVRFTHVGDEWPSWARAESTRRRLAQTWPAPGEAAVGAVTLSRQWFAGRAAHNGELRSICFDPQRTRIIGDDLELFAAE